MAKHNDLGKAGENAAAAYLEKEDYLIRHRNWRKGHFELDIVAAKDNELVVVEVKTRSNTEFAQPEDAVDVPKIRRTVRAADTYIKLFQIDIPVRFDIITVVGENGNFEIEHIKKAFLRSSEAHHRKYRVTRSIQIYYIIISYERRNCQRILPQQERSN